MLDENLVLTLLQASIAGAGLVLAVYALIIPLTRKFLSYGIEAMYAEIEETRRIVGKCGFSEKSFALIGFSTINLDELRRNIDRLEQERRFDLSDRVKLYPKPG